VLVTIKNLTANPINALDAITGGSGVSALYATGGARKVPLPYPFGHIGALAAGASYTLPMHPADWRKPFIPWQPLEPRTEWQQLIQNGIVSFTVAAQPARRDAEELFINKV
jgi:hypothetical protein